jgi:phosphatidylinositol alpha-1,6-mannosyltransferase
MAGSNVPIVVAQNAIDMGSITDELESAECVAEAAAIRSRLPGDGPVILSVGALEPRKKVDQLIEAYKIARKDVPGLRLAIIGDGPDRGRLEALFGGDSGITFAGSILDGVGRWFQVADLFVLPSEGGLAINQAMAYGVPVIATSADGTELDLVKNGETGQLTDEDDIPAMAGAIVAILADPEHARAMGARARQFIMTEVTLDNMVKQVLSLLAKAKTPGMEAKGDVVHAV